MPKAAKTPAVRRTSQRQQDQKKTKKMSEKDAAKQHKELLEKRLQEQINSLTNEDIELFREDPRHFWSSKETDYDITGDIRAAMCVELTHRFSILMMKRCHVCNCSLYLMESSYWSLQCHMCDRPVCDKCKDECDNYEPNKLPDDPIRLRVCKKCIVEKCPVHGCCHFGNRQPVGSVNQSPFFSLVVAQPVCRRCLGLPCVMCNQPADGKQHPENLLKVFDYQGVFSRQHIEFFKERIALMKKGEIKLV